MLAREVVIAGVGSAPITRKGAPDPRLLTLQACRSALADAGIDGSDVDGMFEYRLSPAESPGFMEMQRLLGVRDLAAFSDIGFENVSGTAAATQAMFAVASGACEVALAFRCFTRESAGITAMTEALTSTDPGGTSQEFLAPYGATRMSAIEATAMRMRRRASEFGTTPAEYGHISVNARRWAAMNERAVLRDEISLEDYFASPVLTEPLRLFDCDYPVNCAFAVLITTAERAADMKSKPVYVEAISQATGGEDNWSINTSNYLYGAATSCAERLWSRSSFTPADLDFAQIYDGYTYLVIAWAEALSLCGFGEFESWVDGGKRIGPGGDLPMNTSGGHLAEGRSHGMGLLAEAALQIRGECGDRQVRDARVGVVSAAFFSACGALIVHSG